MEMKTAIIALTRGYPNNKSLYDSLIKRNNAIYNHINQFRKSPSDIILFHEGNISEDDQNYIGSHYPDEIKFIDVSKYFSNSSIKLEGEEKFTLGYRQMCRFHMYHLWKEVSDYKYILRVDEDVEISKFDPYVFEYMDSKNIAYITGRFTKDTHRLTNKTLPKFLINNTNLDVKKIYNHKNPYTNLYATNVDFWKSNDTNALLEKIALSDEQIINRWGDHTVHGLILNHKNEKIKLFQKLEYKHISHSLMIKNNFLRNITINSKFNPISIQEGLYTKIKLKIKGRMNSNNPFDFYNH